MRQQPAGRRRVPLDLRRVLFLMHLWIGVTLCIPFALLGLTGAYLVYDQDVDAPPRAVAVGDLASPEQILAAAVAGRSGLIATAVTMPLRAGDPAIVRLGRPRAAGAPAPQGPGGIVAQVYVDPVSLAVLGERQGVRSGLSNTMHALHGNMMLGGRHGRSVVGWLGVGMTLLGLSGLVLWWPRGGRFRQAFFVRKTARGYSFHRQLHGATGVWGWAVYVIVCFSGVAISFPATMGAVFGTTQTPGPQQLRVTPVGGVAAIGADQAVAIARSAVPNTKLVSVTLPADARAVFRIGLVALDAMRGAPQIVAAVDPYRREVVSLRDPRGGLGDTLMAWQRPLHDGQGLGPVWQALVFLSGLLPAIFAVTGVSMWWIQRRRRTVPASLSGGLEGAAAE
jgi:uncharacterized iron-regulated membrane protein